MSQKNGWSVRKVMEMFPLGCILILKYILSQSPEMGRYDHGQQISSPLMLQSNESNLGGSSKKPRAAFLRLSVKFIIYEAYPLDKTEIKSDRSINYPNF